MNRGKKCGDCDYIHRRPRCVSREGFCKVRRKLRAITRRADTCQYFKQRLEAKA